MRLICKTNINLINVYLELEFKMKTIIYDESSRTSKLDVNFSKLIEKRKKEILKEEIKEKGLSQVVANKL